MDTKSALKQLFVIATRQQEAIKKLAQMQGVPMQSAPLQADMGGELTQKLQDALFAKHPELKNAFVEPPMVGTSADAGAKRIVSFKYHAGKNDVAIKAAVAEAATSVLGPNSFLLQGTGEF